MVLCRCVIRRGLNVVQIAGSKGKSLILKEIGLKFRDFLFFVFVMVSKIGEITINCLSYHSSFVSGSGSSPFIDKCFHDFSKKDWLLEMNLEVERWILCECSNKALL